MRKTAVAMSAPTANAGTQTSKALPWMLRMDCCGPRSLPWARSQPAWMAGRSRRNRPERVATFTRSAAPMTSPHGFFSSPAADSPAIAGRAVRGDGDADEAAAHAGTHSIPSPTSGRGPNGRGLNGRCPNGHRLPRLCGRGRDRPRRRRRPPRAAARGARGRRLTGGARPEARDRRPAGSRRRPPGPRTDPTRRGRGRRGQGRG